MKFWIPSNGMSNSDVNDCNVNINSSPHRTVVVVLDANHAFSTLTSHNNIYFNSSTTWKKQPPTPNFFTGFPSLGIASVWWWSPLFDFLLCLLPYRCRLLADNAIAWRSGIALPATHGNTMERLNFSGIRCCAKIKPLMDIEYQSFMVGFYMTIHSRIFNSYTTYLCQAGNEFILQFRKCAWFRSI